MSKVALNIINLRINDEIAKSTSQIYLNIKPSFQREYESWDNKLKTRLIETMLIDRAMNPIWTIYNDEEDSEEVLDGMHRLTTALQFLNNEFSIGKDLMELESEDYQGKYFRDLTPDQRQKVRNYEFIFNKLDSSYRNDPEKLSDMYELLNRSSKPLNDFEFQKPLLQPYYELLQQYSKSFYNSPLYPYDGSKRGKIEEEIGKWIAFSDDKLLKFSSINDMYKKWKIQVFGQQGKITKEGVQKTLTKYNSKLSNRIDRIKFVMDKFDQSNLFSISKKVKYRIEHMFMVCRTVALTSSNEVFTRILPNLIEQFSKYILEEENKNETRNGAFQNRNGAFQNKLINKIDAILYDILESMNDKRLFTKETIEEKLKEQQGMCAICNKKITEKDKYEGDHINPWTNGGKTIPENLQVVHQRCHKIKSS
jgi:hypothetical protein